MHHGGGRPAADVVHVGAGEHLLLTAEAALHLVDHSLDNDDRTVDDDAEVDGSETHQVDPHARQPHEDEGKEQRQRNDRGCDESAPDAAKQEHQHQYDNQRPLRQVAGYGAGGTADQVGTVEERTYLDVGGQRLLHALHPLLHGLDDLVGIGTLEHQHHAAHGFAAVLRKGPVARLRPEPHVVSHIADEDGCAADVLHHDVAYVVDALHQSFATHEVGQVAPFDIGTARVGIAGAQGIADLADADAHLGQPLRTDCHLVLPDAAAERVDLYHAGYERHLPPDNPVLDGAQLLRRIT